MSSSGSGVATAAGLCYAAIGTDTGGSIRNPASANGVVGLKPTYGRVSRFGVLAMADSLDHVGPMARSVADVAIMFDAIAGRDPKDPTSLDAEAMQAFPALARDIRGVRIGVDRDYALKGIDSGQAAAIDRALQVLGGLGATIVDVRMPDLSEGLEMWSAICGAEIVAAHAATYPSRASEYGPYMREFLAMGTRVTPQQLTAARERRQAFTAKFTAVLESIDAIAGPSGRRSSVADHARHSGRFAAGLSQGLVRRRSAERRVYDAHGSGRCARDLPAVRCLCGWSALQHPVHWPTAQRADAVPHRQCV